MIDRTAEFVRKTGSAGEEQLLAKNRLNKKFAFLAAHSPYHAYYRQRVAAGSAATDSAAEEQRRKEAEERADKQRAEEERQQEEERRQREEREAEARKPRTLQQRLQQRIEASRLEGQAATDLSTDAFASLSQPAFLLPHPSHYSSSELDVVHLTALYASHLGGGFLSSLQQRERTNSAFDFLKPQHPLYAYYGGVRQSVERILNRHTAPLLDEYSRYSQQPSQLLARLLSAARVKRRQQAEESARQREVQEDSEVMAAIDWQDFVVVETVQFAADELQYLPQPKASVEEMEALIAELAIEEQREREERERLDEERRRQERQEQEAMQLEAAAAAELAASMPATVTSTASGAVLEPGNEQLEVRSRAAPLVASAAATAGASSAPTAASSKLVTCVVCGDTIAAEDLEEHLRIELLDPRWMVQKQQLIDRQRETSLVAGKSISDNLRRFERKKREIGRERSRAEEEKQAREDAALLRGAAREDAGSNTDGAQSSVQSSATATASTSTASPANSNLIAAHPASLSASSSTTDEPAPKRARPTSPVALVPPPSVAPSSSTTAALNSPLSSAALPSSVPSATSSGTVASVPSATASFSQPATVDFPPVPQLDAPPTAAPKSSAPQLVDEAVWLSAHPPTLTVSIRVPLDASSPYQLSGRELSVPCRLTDTVDVLKAAVSAQCNALPATRQQLQLLSGAFVKEGHSLAFYNVYDGAVLTLKLKERGGKKK